MVLYIFTRLSEENYPDGKKRDKVKFGDLGMSKPNFKSSSGLDQGIENRYCIS